jgi:uncharacterized membrane protein (UPF0127 family)
MTLGRILLAPAMAASLLQAAPSRQVPSWVTVVLPSGESFGVEVAADDAARARGYMYRREVGPREGMLFWYPEPGRYSFWMKNCLVPLDIVWLDASWRVTHVVERAEPCPRSGPCPSLVPPSEARYILEFAAGTAARHGLSPGALVVVVSEAPLP